MPPVSGINPLIDRALCEPSREHFEDVISLEAAHDAFTLAERARGRATRLVRRAPARSRHIMEARDRLIHLIYQKPVPAGWFCAWCDGSVLTRAGQTTSGVGGLLVDSQGRVVHHFARIVDARPAFETEIAAVAAAMQAAIERRVDRLWIYSDCVALVDRWQRQRGDPRLEPLRVLSRDLRRVVLRAIPRQHNPRANRLARKAISGPKQA